MPLARALLVAVALSSSGCFTLSYLAQQGIGQLRMMHSRRRITEVLADPAVLADTKERLALAVKARNFGVQVLGLTGGAQYTRYIELDGKPLAWNVWAAPKDRLAPIRHRFAVAGAVPYLGYFREKDAHAKAKELEAKGYDVYVGEVAGYSTLGITSDPIFSSMLEGSPAHIAEVTLHEMLHGTLYLAGHSDWNESLATFVGLNGAALFFELTGAGHAAAEQVFLEAKARRDKSDQFRDFLKPFLDELKALYASPRPRDEKLRLREDIFRRIREGFGAHFPTAPGKRPSVFATGPINNALLAIHSTYHAETTEHDAILKRLGGDLRAFIRLYQHAVEDEDDPIGWLKRFAGGGGR